jgi:hypothetical protein
MVAPAPAVSSVCPTAGSTGAPSVAAGGNGAPGNPPITAGPAQPPTAIISASAIVAARNREDPQRRSGRGHFTARVTAKRSRVEFDETRPVHPHPPNHSPSVGMLICLAPCGQ